MKFSIVNTFKYEFSKVNRGLNIKLPYRFAISQWGNPEKLIYKSLYLTYRWALAIFIFSALVVSIIGLGFFGKPDADERRIKWPIYLTNWALLTLVIHLILAAILTTKYHLGKPFENKLIYQIYWVCNTISNTFAPVVTLGYWLLVYDSSKVIDFANVSVHILNTVITIIDVLIVCHPVRLLHMYHSAVVVILYTIFSAIYYLAGGTNRDLDYKIYPHLDWAHNPLKTCILSFLFAIILMLLHIFIWLVYLIRKHTAIYLSRKEIDDDDEIQQTDNQQSITLF